MTNVVSFITENTQYQQHKEKRFAREKSKARAKKEEMKMRNTAAQQEKQQY